MKLSYFILAGMFASILSACMTDSHHDTQNALKVIGVVNTKYPSDQNTFVFVDAPEVHIARYFDNAAVENSVDTGKVLAIISSLALKTNTVVVAGEVEALTATTLTESLTTGKDKINGSKAIVIGAKESQKRSRDLAAASGFTIEFIDNPN